MIVREDRDRAYELKLTRVCEVGSKRLIDSPEAAVEYWREVVEARSWFHPSKEHVVTLLLNTKHQIIGHNLVAVGSLNECIAHPRDILGPVICEPAHAFLLMHNHPSGDPSPSQADTRLTRQVRGGAELLRVELSDHVIVGGREKYFSFREMGLI